MRTQGRRKNPFLSSLTKTYIHISDLEKKVTRSSAYMYFYLRLVKVGFNKETSTGFSFPYACGSLSCVCVQRIGAHPGSPAQVIQWLIMQGAGGMQLLVVQFTLENFI